ncbi:hypothetical protein G3572_01025 [Rhodobacter sp. ETT8]|uniref:Uncharacterized protein n=1 Tax=Pseudotabrizicola algicola TaxID=2709381 RepID=A0A6B3RFA0_9RHOB|nr:hypothetical protein [Pseudotabrizicola algicola]
MVDSSLRILWVGGDWDDFALANGGSAILANDVLSKRLSDYITDITTADTVAQMVQAVIETKGTLRMDYRCDAPHELRRIRLTIKPMKEDRAIMVHELRDAVHLDPPMDPWFFDPASLNLKCSMCGQVYLPGKAWEDPTEPGRRHPGLVSYTVCPTCVGQIAAAINDIGDGAAAADVGASNPLSGFNKG